MPLGPRGHLDLAELIEIEVLAGIHLLEQLRYSPSLALEVVEDHAPLLVLVAIVLRNLHLGEEGKANIRFAVVCTEHDCLARNVVDLRRILFQKQLICDGDRKVELQEDGVGRLLPEAHSSHR